MQKGSEIGVAQEVTARGFFSTDLATHVLEFSRAPLAILVPLLLFLLGLRALA
jgi:hypothetical protein